MSNRCITVAGLPSSFAITQMSSSWTMATLTLFMDRQFSLLHHTFHGSTVYSHHCKLACRYFTFLCAFRRADVVCISSLHLRHKECYWFVMGCVGAAGHDCERTARRGGGQCMVPPPQASGTGNTPLHIRCGRPHSLCGQSKFAVHDNHLMHLYFIDSAVCKQLSHPFHMQS